MRTNERRPSTDGSAAFTGSSDLTIADFVWKWAKNGNPRDRYYTVQAEYLHRSEGGALAVTTLVGRRRARLRTAGRRTASTCRASISFVRAGESACVSIGSTRATTFDVSAPTPLLADHRPSRISAMTDFSNSEFSRLRLQVNRDDSRPQTDDQVVLQYIMSLGAHGAHRF